MMTIFHEWGRDVTELREEQILVVCLLDGNLREADKLGKMYPPFARGESATERFLGSIRTQLPKNRFCGQPSLPGFLWCMGG